MEKRMEEVEALMYSIGVSAKEYKQFLLGEKTEFELELWEDNYQALIENMDGNIVLNCEEMPMYFHGCYWYNDGNFPYFPNKKLKFIELNCGHGRQAYWIDDVKPMPYRRMSLGSGRQYVDDPDGDACVWHLIYTLRKVEEE